MRSPIGNPFKNMPSADLDPAREGYEKALENTNAKSVFIGNALTKSIIALFERNRELLVEQLISTSPDDVVAQSTIRGEISQIETILFILCVK